MPLYPPINSRYLSASSATLKVVYSAYVLFPSNSQYDIISGGQTVEIFISEPELAFQIPKAIFVRLPIKIEINRTVQTPLENCPTSAVRGHVTQHLCDMCILIVGNADFIVTTRRSVRLTGTLCEIDIYILALLLSTLLLSSMKTGSSDVY